MLALKLAEIASQNISMETVPALFGLPSFCRAAAAPLTRICTLRGVQLFASNKADQLRNR